MLARPASSQNGARRIATVSEGYAQAWASHHGLGTETTIHHGTTLPKLAAMVKGAAVHRSFKAGRAPVRAAGEGTQVAQGFHGVKADPLVAGKLAEPYARKSSHTYAEKDPEESGNIPVIVEFTIFTDGPPAEDVVRSFGQLRLRRDVAEHYEEVYGILHSEVPSEPAEGVEADPEVADSKTHDLRYIKDAHDSLLHQSALDRKNSSVVVHMGIRAVRPKNRQDVNPAILEIEELLLGSSSLGGGWGSRWS